MRYLAPVILALALAGCNAPADPHAGHAHAVEEDCATQVSKTQMAFWSFPMDPDAAATHGLPPLQAECHSVFEGDPYLDSIDQVMAGAFLLRKAGTVPGEPVVWPDPDGDQDARLAEEVRMQAGDIMAVLLADQPVSAINEVSTYLSLDGSVGEVFASQLAELLALRPERYSAFAEDEMVASEAVFYLESRPDMRYPMQSWCAEQGESAPEELCRAAQP